MNSNTRLGILAGLMVISSRFFSPAWAAPAKSAGKTMGPRAVKHDFLPGFRDQVKNDPTLAPDLLQEFWQSQQNQKVELLVTTSIEAAHILWRTDRSNAEGALSLLDLTFERFPKARSRYLAVEAKAEILRRSDRLEEASQLLEAIWPNVQSSNLDPVMLPILSERVEVLRAQKKPDQAIELLHEALQGAPPLANWMNFYRLMIDAQSDAGHLEEALRWAVQFFRVAPFQDDDIERATSSVTRLWLQDANSMGKPVLFSAAQSSVEAPNPLQEVARPTLPTEVREAIIKRLQSDAEKEASSSRVSMYLVVGEYRAAMSEAREVLLRDPTGVAGTAEVARVFKAADGDVARANEFLRFYRSGQGTNPLLDFLRETAPREVTP